jgi:integrase
MLRRELAKAQSDTWIEPRDRKVTIGVLVEDLRKDYEASQMTRFSADVKARWELHLKASFDHVPAFALTTTMLNQYKAKRFAEEDKPAVATVNRELQVLRRAYKFAAECDPPKVGRIPVFKLEEEKNARLEFFTPEQVDKIRAAASAEGIEWRALVELAYALGWRRGELLGLRVCDFDLLGGTVRIPTSKNGQPREGVLTENLKLIVQPLLSNREPEARVFSFDEDGFRYPWRRIAKAAGVKLFHSFRRTSARDKRAVDTPASVIMEEMGWTSEAMFRRYAITTRTDKLRSQQKLEEFQAESRTKAAQNHMAQSVPTKQVQ